MLFIAVHGSHQSIDYPPGGVRHLLKSCTRFRNQLDFQLISDFKLDFSDFQAPEINQWRFGQNARLSAYQLEYNLLGAY